MLSVVLTEARIAQDPTGPSIVLEGRRAGFVGWILHKLGLARLSLRVDATSVQWLAASLRGQQRLHAPTEKISDAVAGLRRPVLPILMLPPVALAGVAGMLIFGTVAVLFAPAMICVLLVLIVLFRQRVFLSIRLRSGATLAIQWKRGVIEGVTVDQGLALRIADAIREAVILANAHEVDHADQDLAAEVIATAEAMRADTDVGAQVDTVATKAAAPDYAAPPAAVPHADVVTHSVSVAAPPAAATPPSPLPHSVPTSDASPPATVTPVKAYPSVPPPPPIVRFDAVASRSIASTADTVVALEDRSEPAQSPQTLEPAIRPPVRRRRRSMPVFLGVAVLIAAGGGGTWTLLSPRKVTVRNELLIELLLTLPDGSSARIPARSRTPVSLPRRDVALVWDAADRSTFRDPALAEDVFGDPMRIPSGTDSVVISVGTLAQPVFAPLISNLGSDAVIVVVNAGLRDPSGVSAETDCTCRIEPGVENEFIGYYRAYANSAVRVTSANGRSVTFTDVAGESSPRSGTIPLRVTRR